MLSYREPKKNHDPDELWAGRCMTCKTVVQAARSDAFKVVATFKNVIEPDAWHDLASIECPSCAARVFLMPAAEFVKVAR